MDDEFVSIVYGPIFLNSISALIDYEKEWTFLVQICLTTTRRNAELV